MEIIKKKIKKALRLDPFTGLTPLSDLIYIGSKKHGYHIPGDYFTADSVCYCVGAGEDITFDTELVRLFNSNIFIFDPLPYGKKHFNELKEKTNRNESMTIDTGDFAFRYEVTPKSFERMTYIEKGMWDKDELVKFYEPSLDNYAGHSITNLQKTDKYVEAPVDRLSAIMKQLKHSSIDLLKLEIEGAEYTVLETVVQDKTDVKIICVEFDEVFHSKGMGFLKRIRNCTDALFSVGYVMVHTTDRFKRTYMKRELYETLKLKEN